METKKRPITKIIAMLLVIILLLCCCITQFVIKPQTYFLTATQRDFLDTITQSYSLNGFNAEIEDYNNKYAIVAVSNKENSSIDRHLLDLNQEKVVSSNFKGKLKKNNVAYANSNLENNTYKYDEEGKLIEISRPSMSYKMTYNNNTIASEIIDDSIILNRVFSENDKILSEVYGNGDKITYDYNELGQCISSSKNNNTYLEYVYNDKILSKHLNYDDNREYNYIYDELGNLVSTNTNTGFNINYEYDSDNNLTLKNFIYNDIFVNFHFSNQNVSTDKYTSTFDVDIADRITKKYLALNNINFFNEYVYNVEQPSYDILNEDNYEYYYKEMLCNSNISLQKNNFYEISYGYDQLDNITFYKYGDNEFYFNYDENSQLISYSINNINYDIDYDNSGNIIKHGEQKYSYKKDKIISDDNYKYDAIGNPTVYKGNNLTWEGKTLKQYNDIKYTYNQYGIRTSQRFGEEKYDYYLDGSRVIYENHNGTVITYYYDNNDIVGFKVNDDFYFYVKNIFNDIIAISDEQGNLVVEYLYNPWGKLISIDGEYADTIGKLNPYRYRSYRYDHLTGLYYLNTRYYDPDLGRFLNTDSLSNLSYSTLSKDFTKNLYVYCNNNPVGLIDPNGTMAVWALNLLKNLYSDAKILPDSSISTPVLILNGNGFYTAFHETAQLVAAKKLSNLGMQTQLEYKTGMGEADILAYQGVNYLYEVKPHGTSKNVARKQLNKYVDATGFSKGIGFKTTKINFLPRTTMEVSCEGEGLIFYTFYKEYKQRFLWYTKQVKKEVSESKVKKAINIAFWAGVIVAGAIITATIVEDFATCGVGVADDVLSINIAASSFRGALALGMVFL